MPWPLGWRARALVKRSRSSRPGKRRGTRAPRAARASRARAHPEPPAAVAPTAAPERARRRLAWRPGGGERARGVRGAGAASGEAVAERDGNARPPGAGVGDDRPGLSPALGPGRVAPADASMAGAATPVPAREP